jgi:hypothetical protein
MIFYFFLLGVQILIIEQGLQIVWDVPDFMLLLPLKCAYLGSEYLHGVRVFMFLIIDQQGKIKIRIKQLYDGWLHR